MRTEQSARSAPLANGKLVSLWRRDNRSAKSGANWTGYTTTTVAVGRVVGAVLFTAKTDATLAPRDKAVANELERLCLNSLLLLLLLLSQFFFMRRRRCRRRVVIEIVARDVVVPLQRVTQIPKRLGADKSNKPTKRFLAKLSKAEVERC